MGKKIALNLDLIQPKDKILVAVSGGPDSIALLQLLAGLGQKLHVAHLNHMLRGRSSDKDAEFVKSFTRHLGIPLTIKRIDVKKHLKKGDSVESGARRMRYEFFIKTAKKNRCNKIATAHTLDDQAETVLMRFIRGTGLLGLTGILPERTIDGCQIIRPLLSVTKKEVLGFLRDNKIPYRKDTSNRSHKYTRNKIRLDLMPRLERYNPRLKRVLANMAENIGSDYNFIAEERKKLNKLIRKQKGALRLSIPELQQLPVSMRKEAWKESLELLGSGMKKVGYLHWKSFQTLITLKGRQRTVEFPGKIKATRTKQYIIIKKY